jgi:hypothetical protein
MSGVRTQRSRRRLLRSTIAASALCVGLLAAPIATATSASPTPTDASAVTSPSVGTQLHHAVGGSRPVTQALGTKAPRGLTTSEADAYTFLDEMMDLHASGTTPRLVQSFHGGPLRGFTASFTYDDALTVEAFLGEGSPDGLQRAETIGNGLLYVQEHDPADDGRIRAAYKPTPLSTPADVVATNDTSDVGNMAWVGMALAQLSQATGNTAYLDGAEEIGTWVASNARDTRGAGGYTGGESAGGKRVEWKSTEHNIDLFGLYSMLATLTGDTLWTADADWAEGFVESMWDQTKGDFYVGTLDDGVTPNRSEQPEDVNSWSYLSLLDSAYAHSVTWDEAHLTVSKDGFHGVEFCRGDHGSGVWFEGTAHMADALEFRDGPGDSTQAASYLADIRYAQAHGPNGNGLGIVAASVNGLSDCDGDSYDASLHIGATSWYLLAALKVNPFALV